jgi:hypothetical protein
VDAKPTTSQVLSRGPGSGVRKEQVAEARAARYKLRSILRTPDSGLNIPGQLKSGLLVDHVEQFGAVLHTADVLDQDFDAALFFLP